MTSRGVDRSAVRGARRHGAGGFTIVELMIATLVFSFVLILITVGVLSFTRAYYKGVNQSATQNAARTIMESIAQAIQFSGEEVTSPVPATNGSEGFCIGNQHYSYARGKQLWDDGAPNPALNQTRRALVLNKGTSCSATAAQDLMGNGAVSGTELLRPRMRVSKLSVTPVSGTDDLWRVNIRVIYGDDDLLDDPAGETATCRIADSGSQFCAQSELTTVVKKRISQ